MIEGLKVEVKSAELVEHLERRAHYHEAKKTFYERQAASLAEGAASNPGASNDPVTSLKQSATNHSNRAAFFSFLADHVVPKETYRLDEADLMRIELAGRVL